MDVTGKIPIHRRAVLCCMTLLGAFALFAAKAECRGPDLATLIVHVTDARTGQPIFQAALTLRFRKPGSPWKLKRGKIISYSAKTDKKGFCKLPDVPLGPVVLMVTAPERKAFGRTFEFAKNHQVIEVKLRKPHYQL